MNKSIVFHYLSKAMLIGSSLFLLPALVSLYYKEIDVALTFVLIAVCVALVSLPLTVLKPKNKQMYAREGLVIVALLWVLYPIAGALPFYVSGEIPSLTDAIFESVSGFTTTGATILKDIEALSRGMLFWRSFTHWVGGMGVLVLFIAIMPSSSDAMHLMKAECAGPQVGKIVPKGKNSARFLYITYAVLTVVTLIFLMFGGMPLFDSVCHAMGAAGTGGFSVKNAGIGFYNSAYIEGVITVSTFLFGINFSLYFFILIGRFKEVWKNTELKVYFGIVFVATALLMINIFPIYGSVLESFRHAVYQVVALVTSTCFVTTDYCTWPMLSQMIIMILMFVGACAGSTGGGFKIQRVIIMFKSGLKYLKKIIHPKSVNIVKSDDKTMDVETVHGVHNYLIIYIFLMFVSFLLIAINNKDFSTTYSSVIACINNMGPGLEGVGPTQNYSSFSDFSKYVLSFDMLLGRLECLPLVILVSPSVWRKSF